MQRRSVSRRLTVRNCEIRKPTHDPVVVIRKYGIVIEANARRLSALSAGQEAQA
jgi:hypothetical protein